jgi:hypothetical protein
MAGRKGGATKRVNPVTYGGKGLSFGTLAHITENIDDVPAAEKQKVAKQSRLIRDMSMDFLQQKIEVLSFPCTEAEVESRAKTRLTDIVSVIGVMSDMGIAFGKKGKIELTMVSGEDAEKMLDRFKGMREMIAAGGVEGEIAAKTILQLAGEDVEEIEAEVVEGGEDG